MRKLLKWLAIATTGLIVLSVVYVAIADSGSILVSYGESQRQDHQRIKAELKSWGGFETAAMELDDALLLPKDIDVWFAECGDANAFYNPENRQVVLCYELIMDLSSQFSLYVTTEADLAGAVWTTTFFVFYHELGHALIDVLNLPVTGREEDVVDQLATLILLNGGEAGLHSALNGASWFWLNSQRSDRRTPFWDTHSLDQQRYFNVLCWVYGSGPEAYQELLSPQWGLPAERAVSCPGEYARMAGAWDRVLEDHTY